MLRPRPEIRPCPYGRPAGDRVLAAAGEDKVRGEELQVPERIRISQETCLVSTAGAKAQREDFSTRVANEEGMTLNAARIQDHAEKWRTERDSNPR